MRIIINKKEVTIDNKLYNVGEKISDLVLKTIAAKSQSTSEIPMYYATVIALHKRTAEILNSIDSEDIDILMRAWQVNQLKTQKDEDGDFDGISKV
jgi:hypothetical protein